MGRLIEESKVIEILQTSWLNGTVAHRITDEIKQRIKLEAPTVEAIPKDQYEARLKADMVAMLTELQLEIEEHEESIIGHYGKETKESDFPSHKIERNNGRKECVGLIQQKINALKAETEVEDDD